MSILKNVFLSSLLILVVKSLHRFGFTPSIKYKQSSMIHMTYPDPLTKEQNFTRPDSDSRSFSGKKTALLSLVKEIIRPLRWLKKDRKNKITDYPKLSYHDLTPQQKYDLQWYVVGKSSDFVMDVPQKVTVWDKHYVVWKNATDHFHGLDDACSHKGASLSKGQVYNNSIICPYHAYEFNCDGKLTFVPGISFRPSPIQNMASYKVIEKNGWVYLNTLDTLGFHFDENIFCETEEINRNDSVVFLDMDFKCYSRILSENSLDVMHIGFVHTFGNANKPAPIEIHPPQMISPYHYKTSYFYESGEQSIARRAFEISDMKIENEFYLPHTTVARVIFGEYVSTIITFALPISETKSKLFVKTYRNFWKNPIGDKITKNMMYNTLLQDKFILENIDPRFMDGKFNMKFDKLQNTYKTFYKKFIRNNESLDKN